MEKERSAGVTLFGVILIFAFWTPIIYFYSKMMFTKAGSSPPLFTEYEIIDLFLILFGLCAIYFFTRPKVKEQFK